VMSECTAALMQEQVDSLFDTEAGKVILSCFSATEYYAIMNAIFIIMFLLYIKVHNRAIKNSLCCFVHDGPIIKSVSVKFCSDSEVSLNPTEINYSSDLHRTLPVQ